jgi:hypothetical protein
VCRSNAQRIEEPLTQEARGEQPRRPIAGFIPTASFVACGNPLLRAKFLGAMVTHAILDATRQEAPGKETREMGVIAAGGASLTHDLVVALSAVALGSLLAWGIGTQVAYVWDERRRRREADLAALAAFYRLYGEFFSTWKLWAAHTRFGSTVASPPDVQWSLLHRAEEAEGGFEALLIKLAAERGLQPHDVRLLGCFREAYQTLRETIRENKVLGWIATRPVAGAATPRANYNPPTANQGFIEYRAFKALAEYVAVLLERPRNRRRPVRDRAHRRAAYREPNADPSIRRLLEITDRPRYTSQQKWWQIATADLRLDDRETARPAAG